MENKILDSTITKDLSNHIYEKRKATAFQIETFTKNALSKNDSDTIHKIIAELADLMVNGTNSARMGAITALGSVSVALGSYAIAYFLDEIINPIFATFRDTDARVRYYACESLYNIAKIARGEILLYFNEVFDVLCVLVTDTELSVKNAADILDRLIKDIVSAKLTNYVSILHQKEELEQQEGQESYVIDPKTGVALQKNHIQDSRKAFSLPKFIPTLLERMYTIDPFAKKFLMSWLELLDDIPALELITFIPNFLEPLVKFLMNNAPTDVTLETQNLLNNFLQEIKAIQKVKMQVKQKALEKEERAKRLNKELKPSGMTSPVLESEGLQPGDTNDGIKSDDLVTIQNGNDLESKSDRENDNSSAPESNEPKKQQLQIQTDNINSEPKIELENDDEDDSELFLDGQDIFIDYPIIVDILLSFIRYPEGGKKFNETRNETYEVYYEIQVTVLNWLQEILQINPTSFIKLFPDCVGIILKNVEVSENNRAFKLRAEFLNFNSSLQTFLSQLHEVKQKAVKSQEDQNDSQQKSNNSISSEDSLVNSTLTLERLSGVQIDDRLLRGITADAFDEFIESQLSKTLHTINQECFDSSNELARITGLDWLIFLYEINPSRFFNEIEGKSGGKKIELTAFLRVSSTDSSNDVIFKVLQLLSKISDSNHHYFKEFIVGLIKFFETELQDNYLLDHGQPSNSSKPPLNRSKINFIIRKLCVTLDAEKIFRTLSEVLSYTSEEKKKLIFNLDFLDMMTVTLNNILLTAQELSSFRRKMKNLDFSKQEDWSLFLTVFNCFCHNAPSALSLCLLTTNYELSYLIITELCELEVSFQLLTQLDILVQLLESPIFVKLRLQLLEPEKNPHLYKTLYGLLMILPQSSTFTALKNRLSSVAHTKILNSTSSFSSIPVTISSPVNSSMSTSLSSVSYQLSLRKKRIYEMLDKFTKIQEMHESESQPYDQQVSVYELDIDSKKNSYSQQNPTEKKDYFGDSNEKRKSSGRFGFSRFNLNDTNPRGE